MGAYGEKQGTSIKLQGELGGKLNPIEGCES